MRARTATCLLDANAGSPLPRRVREVLAAALDSESQFGVNPSSAHALGREARRRVNGALDAVAISLGETSGDWTLTSSGTEANQQAIRSALESALARREPVHWIIGATEHESCHRMRAWAEAQGVIVEECPVDGEGRPVVLELGRALRPETRLVSLSWVNNETGVIADLAAVSAVTREANVPLHVDAAQAWGKLPIRGLASLGITYASFSGLKIGALAGTGILWSSAGASVEPLIRGKQQLERRGGTENVLGAVAIAAAASDLEPFAWAETLAPLRVYLEERVLAEIPGSRVNGAGAERIANTSNIGIEGVRADGLTAGLDLEGFAVSAGAACAAGTRGPSRVLMAMGQSPERAMTAIRVSLPPAEEPTRLLNDLDLFVEALKRVVGRSRAWREAQA